MEPVTSHPFSGLTDGPVLWTLLKENHLHVNTHYFSSCIPICSKKVVKNILTNLQNGKTVGAHNKKLHKC